MYGDCVASTSRLAIQDDWDPLPSLWTFPVSDCRYESNIPDTHPKPPSPVRSHPTADVPSVPPLAPAARSSYSSAVPVLKQLSPGVWTDGKDTLLSAALPEVQELLAAARSRLSLPKASSELIFTLAALEVFYKPADPAHWLFWSDDKKSTTADVVTRIACESPPALKPPHAALMLPPCPCSTPTSPHHFPCRVEWKAGISLNSCQPPWKHLAPVLRIPVLVHHRRPTKAQHAPEAAQSQKAQSRSRRIP